MEGNQRIRMEEETAVRLLEMFRKSGKKRHEFERLIGLKSDHLITKVERGGRNFSKKTIDIVLAFLDDQECDSVEFIINLCKWISELNKTNEELESQISENNKKIFELKHQITIFLGK